MAVSDVDKHYYKIDIDKSYVNDCVNVYFDIYNSEEDRLLEKSRIVAIKDFLKTAAETIALIDSFITCEQIDSEREGERRYSTDPIFRDNLDLQRELGYIINNQDVLFYSRNGIHKTLVPSANLLKLSFDPAGVNEPINLTSGGLTNCGLYQGEEINYALYYKALKRIIKSKTADLL